MQSVNLTTVFFDNPQNYLHKDFGIRVRCNIVRNVIGEEYSKSILDLGCGDGSISMQFNLASSVVLVDPSHGMLGLATQKIAATKASNVVTVNTTVEDFSSEKSYDLVLGIGILAHVDNWVEAIEKISSLIVSGGTAVLQISDSSRPLTRIQRQFNRTGKRKLNCIDANELVRIGRSFDLELVQKVRYGLMIPGMGLCPNDLLFRYMSWTVNNPIVEKFCSEVIMFFKKR